MLWAQPTDDCGIAHRGSGRGLSARGAAQRGRPSAARGRGPRLRVEAEAALGVGGARSTAWTYRTTNPVGREGALVRGASQRAQGRGIDVSLATPAKLRRRQQALYAKATQDDTCPRREGVSASPRPESSGNWESCGCGALISDHPRMPGVNPVREPDAGAPHVRFDEEGRETRDGPLGAWTPDPERAATVGRRRTCTRPRSPLTLPNVGSVAPAR